MRNRFHNQQEKTKPQSSTHIIIIMIINKNNKQPHAPLPVSAPTVTSVAVDAILEKAAAWTAVGRVSFKLALLRSRSSNTGDCMPRAAKSG